MNEKGLIFERQAFSLVRTTGAKILLLAKMAG
jgi:hypothetical protein